MGYFVGKKDLRPPTPRKDAPNPADWPDSPKSVLSIEIAYIDLPEDGPDKVEGVIYREAVVGMSFKNGKVGEFYRAEFRLFDVAGRRPKGEYVLEYAQGFEELGLSCRVEGERLTVEGTPTAPFEGVVLVTAYVRPQKGSKDKIEEIIVRRSFSILPNSVDLWEEHDPPKDVRYADLPLAKSDGASLCPELGIIALAARKRGRAHAHVAAFCDDFYVMRAAPSADMWHVFAVADGAGSAEYSRKGAELACSVSMLRLFEELNYAAEPILPASAELCLDADVKGRVDELFYRAVYDACRTIKAEADGIHASSRFYSTTLLLLALKYFPGDRRWVALSYWVGDGALGVYRPAAKDGVLLLGEPDSGEYAGETRFLTSPGELDPAAVSKRARVTVLADFEAIVMTTDGVSDPFFPSDSKLRDFECWREFWTEKLPAEAPNAFDAELSPAERAEALLKGLDFRVRGFHDDRTMLAIVNDGLKRKMNSGADKAPTSTQD